MIIIPTNAVMEVSLTKNGDGEVRTHNPPLWCICREGDDSDAGVYVDWLFAEPDDGQDVIDDRDDFKIVPEEDWPDEVCVAVAKRALLGELTK